MRLEFRDSLTWLDGEDVTAEIRTPEVTAVIRYVADPPEVRRELVQQQRRLAGEGLVTEGRDQGTVVFPQADCKIFLTASPEERARRRFTQLKKDGVDVAWEDVLAQQNQRDQEDAERPEGRLHAADDALMVITDGMGVEEVAEHLEAMVRRRIPSKALG